MTEAQRKLRELRDRQSKERQRMAELSREESLTDETRAELDKIEAGTPDLERQIRAATAALEDEERESEEKAKAENAPDAEMRERLELRGKARLSAYFLAAAKGRMVDGAEAELQAAAGVNGIPIELWDTPKETRSEDGEQRALTPAPDTVGVNLDPIRPAVFAKSIAPMLGIAMPRVESGTYASGTVTTSAVPAAKNKGDDIAATAGAITVSTATPKRVSARLELSLEDIAAVGADNFESILRENLSLALSDELDKQAIQGDGAAPNLTGILARLGDPAAIAGGAPVAAFDTFVAAFAGGVDGLWASTTKDVAIVCGVDTYRLSAAAFRDAAGQHLGGTAFSDYAANLYGGWWTNKRMPAVANKKQSAILHRKGRMGMRTAVCPHWGEVSIDDIYSGAASGTRSFTLHVLLGDVILIQPDAYAELAFKVVA